MTNHTPGSLVISGDHQFSASRFLQGIEGVYDFKGIYTLLNEKHYIIALTWVREESYAALKNLFDFVLTLAEPLVIYVDKCCGRGSFGDCIRRYCPRIIVLLDLFHAIRRLRKAAKKHCVSTKRFIREMSRAHWKVSPTYENCTDISSIPQSDRCIPPPPELLANLEAVMTRWADQPCMTESVLQWWAAHKVHVVNGCLSDPPVELTVLGADGKLRSGRGSVKNEGFHRGTKRANTKWTASGPALRAASHRAVATRWNLTTGALVDGRFFPPLGDLQVVLQIRQAAQKLLPNAANAFDHPCWPKPQQKRSLFFDAYKHDTSNGLRQHCTDCIRVVSAFVSSWSSCPFNNTVLPESPINWESQLLSEPTNFKPIAQQLVDEPQSLNLLDALTSLFVSCVDTQESESAMIRMLLETHIVANIGMYAALLSAQQKLSVDVAALCSGALEGARSTSSGAHPALYIVLKAFCTIIDLPLVIVAPNGSTGATVLPHPDIPSDFRYRPCRAPVLMWREQRFRFQQRLRLIRGSCCSSSC
jgi:hypothetical protein